MAGEFPARVCPCRRSSPARPLLGTAIALSLAGCAATTASKPTAVEANVTTKAVGYGQDRSAGQHRSGAGTTGRRLGGLALDEQVSREARALRGSPRFAQAGVDAELGFPQGANHFPVPPTSTWTQ